MLWPLSVKMFYKMQIFLFELVWPYFTYHKFKKSFLSHYYKEVLSNTSVCGYNYLITTYKHEKCERKREREIEREKQRDRRPQ